MAETEYQAGHGALIAEGIDAVEQGNTALGLSLFSRISEADVTPLALSYKAYCLAREHHAIQAAINMTKKALIAERTHPLIYLNLGRIYYSAGYEQKALDIFCQGLRYQRHPLLLRRVEMLCPRRRCLFPFLSRSNPLNVTAGKILSKLF